MVKMRNLLSGFGERFMDDKKKGIDGKFISGESLALLMEKFFSALLFFGVARISLATAALMLKTRV